MTPNTQEEMKLVTLGELPLAEKERFFEFLVANKVEFIAEDEENFVATIKVVPPELSTARINGRARASAQNRPRSVSVPGGKKRSQGGSRAAIPGPVQDVQTTARAAQACLRKRYRRFCQQLPPMAAPPKALAKAAILRFAEDLYEDRYEKDASLTKRIKEGDSIPEQQGFPEFVFEFCKHRYGLKQVVSNNCWGLVSSVELLRGQHIGIETLGRFMEQTFDSEDLLFFLSLRIAVEKCLSMSTGHAAEELGGDEENARSEKHAKARAARDEKTNRKKQIFQKDRLDPKQCLQIIRSTLSASMAEYRDKILKVVDQTMARFSWAPDGSRRSPSLEPERLMQVAVEEYHNVRISKMPPVGDDDSLNHEPVRKEPEPAPLPKDKELEPNLRKEVKQVAGRLYTTLGEQGVSPINRQAIQDWAMQVVLRRNKTGEFSDDFPPEVYNFMDLDEMNDEALSYQRSEDAARPSNMMPAIDDVLNMSPDEFEYHLESNIRQLLLAATGDVIQDSIDQALGDEALNVSALHAALMSEFAPVADILMEAVVGRDVNKWNRALQIEGSGNQRHRQAFMRLHDDFQDVVSKKIDAEAVLHICRGITSAEEFNSLIRNRAVEINRHGQPGYEEGDDSDDEDVPMPTNHKHRSSLK
mmetsp:Transcript_23412/g.43491  ORF Transcript_23412/g.43491 Transcript_23412/m.43491 type:complete len:643 (+) Transcript_23412:93-2021(+)